MSRSRGGNGILLKGCKNAVLLALALAALIALLPGVASADQSRTSLTSVQREAARLIDSVNKASGIDATSAAKKCTVPKLTKLTFKKAAAKLKKAGCGKAKVKRIYSSKIKQGRVVKQTPKAGKKVKLKTRVTVWLSLGKKLCVVK